MAAVTAGAANVTNEPLYDVLGIDLPSKQADVDKLNRGICPIRSEDRRLESMIKEAVGRKNFIASTNPEFYALADIIVVDISLDYDRDRKCARMSEFEGAIRDLGRRISPNALIIIESTMPPGATEFIALPAFREEFKRRGLNTEPLLAYAYERVMPGAKYIDSIKSAWRSVASSNPKALDGAKRFLASIGDNQKYPPRTLPSTTAAEMAKVLENSYRAMNIAFIHEWSLFAERAGVNLFEVVGSIRVRKGTHDNMMLPGFGVGGYCLTKDGYLAQWGASQLCKTDVPLELTLRSMAINENMPLHTFNLLAETLGDVDKKNILVCGLSYLADVADIRNTPTKVLFDAIRSAGGQAHVHDPIVDDLEGQIPSDRFSATLDGLRGFDAVVFAVRHREYLELTPPAISRLITPRGTVVDAFDVLPDDKIIPLLRQGIKVVGVGKGHIRTLIDGFS